MDQSIRHLPVENLRCKRDPDCKKHEYHAGHLDCLGATSPRKDYELRQRNKIAGKEAYNIIRHVQKYYKIQLTPTQKFGLHGFIKNALFFKTQDLHKSIP